MRLQTWQVGGTRMTSERAITEFIERLSQPATATPSRTRAKEIAAAERRLEAAGV